MKLYDVFVNIKEDGNDIWCTDLGYEDAKKQIRAAREELGSVCLDAWMEPASEKRRAEIETGF